jgi:menaquinone-dependent protoporphyrinogen oxidase
MKTLVMYASKNGYSRECAQQIASNLGDGSVAVDCKKEAKKTNLADFGAVVLGGGIHVGKLPGYLSRYCAKNTTDLMGKKIGLFLCCTETDPAGHQKYFDSNFPAELVKQAQLKGWFGGRIIFAEHNVVTRAILKKIQGTGDDFRGERPESVRAFIEDYKKFAN